MTSRKNQQAARQYMREHDVPYMEALRRTTSGASSPLAAQAPIPGRPWEEPPILGYIPPQKQAEPAGPSFMDRLRRRPQEPTPVPAPTPYVADWQDSSRPRLVSVYGPPGTGKTMFLRAILEQFRGHAAYVVHDGHLLDGPTLPGGQKGAGIEPWEGLVEVNLQPWLSGVTPPSEHSAPTPPPPDRLPFGSLVLFDLRDSGAREGDGGWSHERQDKNVVREWRLFESKMACIAHSKGITVATSVLTSDVPVPPLHWLSAPLGRESIGVMLARREPSVTSGAPWVYEAFDPASTTDPTPFLLTEEEASRLYIPRVITEEEEEQERWKSAVALERFFALRR